MTEKGIFQGTYVKIHPEKIVSQLNFCASKDEVSLLSLCKNQAFWITTCENKQPIKFCQIDLIQIDFQDSIAIKTLENSK